MTVYVRNFVCHRSMSGKTCPRLVEILGLSVTMTGNFFQFLLYIQWCDRSKLAMTGQNWVSISQVVLWYENSIRIETVMGGCFFVSIDLKLYSKVDNTDFQQLGIAIIDWEREKKCEKVDKEYNHEGMRWRFI